MKTYTDLVNEIKRQEAEIKLGNQIEYDFGDWVAEDTLDDDVLKYFKIGIDEYNFVIGNNKLKALCQQLN